MILFSSSARRTFIDIIRYIKVHENRPMAAARFFERSKAKLERLKRFPNSGRKIPEIPDLEHREVLITPYRFIYKVRERKVYIVAIWHQSQIIEEPD
jgi:plasmid stabilization system protein ParE